MSSSSPAEQAAHLPRSSSQTRPASNPAPHEPARRQRSLRWQRELLLAAVLYALYDAIRGKIGASTATAEHDGSLILRAEQTLHLDPEHALNLFVTHDTWLAVPACFFYATLHFVVTPAVLIWAFRRRPQHYRMVRSVLATLTCGALIGFWLFPTAPPRLLTGGGFLDTLDIYHSWGWWGAGTSVPTAAAALANDYAAMPSLHLAWAAWAGAVVFALTSRRWVRTLALAYPITTALVVLGTANHYLFDVLAGTVLSLAAYASVYVVSRFRSKRRAICFVA